MSVNRKRRRALRVTQLESCEPRLMMSAAPSSLLYEYFTEPLAAAQTSAAKDITPDNGAAAEIRARYGFTGQGQTVAVIDSGIAYDHIALGQGYGAGKRVVGGYDFAEQDQNPYDDGLMGSHGTHVAGIIGSDNTQHMGVAPGVDMVALRVFNDAGDGSLDWVKSALQWVHDHRNDYRYPITTVNLSLGLRSNGNQPPAGSPFEAELAQLYADGIFVAAAAGNSFTTYATPGVTYPASSPYVVPVASLDANGNLSSFSQRNDRAIAVPGRSIVSSVPDYVGNHNGRNDDYVAYSGTSMASPYLAGAAVLLRQAYWTVGTRSVTEAQIYQQMVNTADTVYDSATGQNYHRLNLLRAVSTIVGASIPITQNERPGLYQSGTGAFALQSGSGTANQFTFGPGGSQWVALAGDWNGDGVKTIGLYNSQTGAFWLRNSNSGGAAETTFYYGAAGAGWLPIVGDWNGDGVDSIGLYDPNSGLFYLRNSNSTGMADATLGFGAARAGWTPLAGDWNGDGVDTIGVYDGRAANFYLRNSNTTGIADNTLRFGTANSGAVAVAGDWNGDGQTTVGLFNPGDSTFSLRNSNTSGTADSTLRSSGGTGWRPLVGTWGTTVRTATTSSSRTTGSTTRLSLPTLAAASNTSATLVQGQRLENLSVRTANQTGPASPQELVTSALPAQAVDQTDFSSLVLNETSELENLMASLSESRIGEGQPLCFDAIFAGEDLRDPAALPG